MDVAEPAAILTLLVISLVSVLAILVGTLAFQLLALENSARTRDNKNE